MRQAAGYLTDDGTFFDNANDAELYESIEALTAKAEAERIDPTKLIAAVDKCQDEIRRYIDAKLPEPTFSPYDKVSVEAKYDPKAPFIIHWPDDANNKNPLGIDHTDNARATGYAQAVFEQPSRSDESMSNMGSGISAETLRDNSPLDGPGSRRSDASSIRSDPDMAVTLSDEFAKTRIGRS